MIMLHYLIKVILHCFVFIFPSKATSTPLKKKSTVQLCFHCKKIQYTELLTYETPKLGNPIFSSKGLFIKLFIEEQIYQIQAPAPLSPVENLSPLYTQSLPPPSQLAEQVGLE